MESKEDSKESGVSFKSDRSQYFKIWSSLIVLCCASAERDDSQGRTAHVKETPPSPKEKMAKGSMESIDSGVSFKSDGSNHRVINFKDRVSLSRSVLSSYLMDNPVADDEDWGKSSVDLMAKGSMESIDSGVSFKSDWSRSGLIDFKDRLSPSRSDLSSYLMDNPVAHHKDLVKSPNSLMPRRRAQSEPVKSNFLIPLRQQSPLVMVLRSMDAFGSGLSLISDSFIRTGQRSPPRDEMNQELLSEVG